MRRTGETCNPYHVFLISNTREFFSIANTAFKDFMCRRFQYVVKTATPIAADTDYIADH